MNPKTGNNIINAVRVINSTHESIDKLIEACKDLSDGEQTHYKALKKGGMTCCELDWWLVQSFVQFYQHIDSVKHGNEIYLMDINIEEDSWVDGKPVWKNDEEHAEDAEAPVICLAKFVYEDATDALNHINFRTTRQRLHWEFTQTLYGFEDESNEDAITETTEATDWGSKYVVHRVVDNGVLQDYNGVKSVIYTAIPLMDVTAENLKEKVFGTFDKLSEM